VEFYLPKTVDLKKAKHEALQDMGHKHRQWSHDLKSALKIQPDNTPETICERMGPSFLEHYDTIDLEHLLVRWCTEKHKVRRS
jgi:hypothetical protein